ncbi:MAG: ABC transporter ATP-binding protein [Proteobacteria bacterium]|nr:MAG: ABC transporter ATP-binding protein [Pseudomonadota bacterium]
MSRKSLLSVKNLSVRYGAIQALKQVSFELFEGEILCLLGANGAGKTTLLKALSGSLTPHEGDIYFDGGPLLPLPTEKRAQQGLIHVPEGRGIFLNLTVEENLDLGAWTKKYTPAQFQAKLEEVFGLFPRLKERLKQNSGTLSGGEQQMLAIGRAWMAEPKVLLLDEPSLGLAPQLIDKIFEIISTLRDRGATILLVEQNAEQALSIGSRGILLETGSVRLQGEAQALLNSEEMRKSYLGLE